jgi:predicted nucleic acid-binding protein
MTGLCFVDTNVLVYVNDSQVPHKQQLAIDLVADLIEQEQLVLSSQVLNELANTLFKPRFGFRPDEVREALAVFAQCPVVAMDAALSQRALDVRERYGLPYWDALTVAAAERGRCQSIVTEDLSHGQEYFGIVARNPFLSDVSEL